MYLSEVISCILTMLKHFDEGLILGFPVELYSTVFNVIHQVLFLIELNRTHESSSGMLDTH